MSKSQLGGVRIDLTGHKYGRLTVLRRSPDWVKPSGRLVKMWECLCECGSGVIIRGGDLRNGGTVSCGCWQREISSVLHVKHGGAGTAEYKTYQGMLFRCSNPAAKEYKHYGGRGIKVCERWRESFAHFLSDMGRRPSGTTLDRFPDNDGNYEPGNCRWATSIQQARNRRNTPTVDFNGREISLPELAEITRTPFQRISSRYHGMGWRDAASLTKPPRRYKTSCK